MKRLAMIVVCILMAGCVGNPEPHNPMKGYRATQEPSLAVIPDKPWWSASTAGVAKKNNPWNKFIPTYKKVDRTNPWADFQNPRLFPVEKETPRKKTMPQREKKYFGRSI